MLQGPSWPWVYGSLIYNYLCNQCISPLLLWVRILIRARCTILCDKVCQWLATGRWFSPRPPVSSTNKTDRHDIPEILLNTSKQTNKQTNIFKHICTILNIHSFFPYESVCLGYQTGSIKYMWANLCFIVPFGNSMCFYCIILRVFYLHIL
jgi:hypothetical protein